MNDTPHNPPAQPASPATTQKKPRLGRTRLVFIGMALAAGVVWLGYTLFHTPPAPPAKPQVVTVEAAIVARSDVPQYLEGIGAVQAFNTATINARVDGQLTKVAFTEGQNVKQGDLLAQIDPRPYQATLDLATATKSKDEAQLANAKRDLERYLELAPKNLASKQTVDTQHALVDQLTAQVKADQANIDSAQTQLDYTAMTSPIDGRTGIRLVDVGNNVHATDTTGIVVVTQMQPISLIFTLPEDALAQVTHAMAQGPIGIAALSQDDKTALDQGTLLLVDNQIDQTTGTIKLKATFPNAESKLWPGQFINARLLLDVKKQALIIPTTAAQRGPDGMFVYVIKQDSTVEARPVKTGAEIGKNLLIESGLQEGEHIVISNQYRLQPGMAVKADADEAKSDQAAPNDTKDNTTKPDSAKPVGTKSDAKSGRADGSGPVGSSQ